MSENPGGTPPRDDEPAKAAEPVAPEASVEPPEVPDPVVEQAPAAPPAPPAPEPAPPVAPPAPPVAPAAPPVAPPAPPAGGYPPPPPPPPPAPDYGQPPASPYGQPAPGSYPPPPAPAYGQAPPGAYPPPPPGYGAPMVQPSPIGEAYSYGWKGFTRSGGLFILATLIWLVIGAAVAAILWALLIGSASLTDPNGNGGGMIGVGFSFVTIILYAALALVGYLIEAAFIRAALGITDGRATRLGDFFTFTDVGPILLTALLLAGINLVVGFVSWIPIIGWLISVAVNFLVFFTLWFVIDKHISPIEALRSSVQLITANLSTTILFYLLSLVVIFVGALLCGIGLFVAIPVVLIATAFLFRRLLGDPIAQLVP